MIAPLNNEELSHFLKFGEDEPVQIAEPIKFDAANFVLKQHAGGLGRDVSFASGTVNLQFSSLVDTLGLTHQFDKLIFEYQQNGFEADVKYILRAEDGIRTEDYVIGQLDFKKADTDEYTHFDCMVIQDTKEARVRRRKKTKVDVFSSVDIYGNAITPVEAETIFLRSTPKNQISSWEMPQEVEIPRGSPALFFSPAVQIIKSGFADTFSPFSGYLQLSDSNNPILRDFSILQATNKILGATLKVRAAWSFVNSAAFVLRIKKGITFETSEYIYNEDLNEVEAGFVLDLEIPIIEKGEQLFFYFNAQSLIGGPDFTMETLTVELEGVAKSISSTIKVVQFGKAIQQVIKSISGFDVDAPRFLDGGDLTQQYITNGLLIRNIVDKPFNLSLEDIMGQFPEWRGDYEVTEDNVFFGIFDDFYKNEKMASFAMEPNDEFKSVFNDEYTVNTLSMQYSKYEKTNEEDGSRESVHTKLQLSLPNNMVEDNKSIKIGFVRDSFLIESNREKAIIVTDETATENDEDVFMIDVIEKLVLVEEAFVVNHLVVDPTLLRLINDNSFNWLFLGFLVDDFITLTGENAGTWRIGAITATELTLIAVGGSSAVFEGVTLTKINYTVTETNLTNRTDEGFDFVVGGNANSFSNLRFSKKRNVINYWGKYLLTACQFQQSEDMRVTEYIHGGNVQTQLAADGFILTEDGNIDYGDLGTNGVNQVTPWLLTTKVICEFSQFWQLRADARTVRGFIEVANTRGEIKKVFPKELSYQAETKYLTIIGEVALF